MKDDVEALLQLCKALISNGDLDEDGVRQLSEYINESPDVTESWPGNILLEPLQKAWSDGNIDYEELKVLAKLLAYILNPINDEDIELVEQWIDSLEDLNAVNNMLGDIPLHYAARKGQKEVTELLINKGADVNLQCENGYTALSKASNAVDKDTVALLINKGADPNIYDNLGWGPLHSAAGSGDFDDSSIKLLEILINGGANINALYAESVTPLDTATQYFEQPKTVSLLRKNAGKKGAELSVHIAARGNLAHKKADIEALEKHLASGVDVNMQDEWGCTPLHEAALGGQKDAIELLIANGADVNAITKNGRTPLDSFGIHQSTGEIFKKDICNDIPDFLRKHGDKTAEELKAEGK
ncbi:MAG TPA: hypothetical protein EYM96_07865 [Rhodospirillales bacterium]|nr:hypothetical protein [Rhodospirillales bacterium]HIO67084.1 hypothetical protein [Flavobacteriales bacterium]